MTGTSTSSPGYLLMSGARTARAQQVLVGSITLKIPQGHRKWVLLGAPVILLIVNVLLHSPGMGSVTSLVELVGLMQVAGPISFIWVLKRQVELEVNVD